MDVVCSLAATPPHDNVKGLSSDIGATLVTFDSDMVNSLVNFDNFLGLRQELIKTLEQ